MVWDLIPTLVTLAPGETTNLTCLGLEPDAWCFLKPNGLSKINKDDSYSIHTIQVNGSHVCLDELDINLTIHPVPPVCDNMLVYCIEGHSCSGFDGTTVMDMYDTPLYTLAKMQKNPFYIHIDEKEACPSPTKCPTPLDCSGLMDCSMTCPAKDMAVNITNLSDFIDECCSSAALPTTPRLTRRLGAALIALLLTGLDIY